MAKLVPVEAGGSKPLGKALVGAPRPDPRPVTRDRAILEYGGQGHLRVIAA